MAGYSNPVSHGDGGGETTRGALVRARVAYIMSRFPKISETFILYEILELGKLGLDIEIFPLVHHREPVKHSEADALAQHTHYYPLLSWAVLTAQFFWLRRRPTAYLGAWWGAIRGNLRSPKFLSRALAVVPLAALFARQMQTLGVTHVHAHWATHPALAAYIIRQLTGLSYSFTAHSHDIQADRTMLGEKIRHARFVITISEHNRNFIGALYGPTAVDKTRVVHCGIDPEVFQPRQDRKPNATFTIACVARLEEIKGHIYLIEACAYLKDRGIPFRCLLIGDGLTRPQINAQIASLKLENHVSLLGSQPQH
ncbi:MAG: glycosyltransferase, partial [Chloroflexota bacterium]